MNRSARVTVFHSIVQQDRQQAGDIVRHAADTQTGGDLRRQFFSGGLGKGTEIFDAAIRQFAERYGCDGRRRQSLLAACQLHEIFDKAVHALDLLLPAFQPQTVFLCFFDQSQVGGQDRKGRFQLVGGVCHELPLPLPVFRKGARGALGEYQQQEKYDPRAEHKNRRHHAEHRIGGLQLHEAVNDD